jgi:hypothetical protein
MSEISQYRVISLAYLALSGIEFCTTQQIQQTIEGTDDE